jgi:hypothetical protein
MIRRVSVGFFNLFDWWGREFGLGILTLTKLVSDKQFACHCVMWTFRVKGRLVTFLGHNMVRDLLVKCGLDGVLLAISVIRQIWVGKVFAFSSIAEICLEFSILGLRNFAVVV